MDLVFKQVMKFFSPAMLEIPSPELGAPANWLIPILLWASLLRYLISIIRDEHFRWLMDRTREIAKHLGKLFHDALTYPEPRPLREMIADLGNCILHYLLGVYFFLYGMSIALLSWVSFIDHAYGRGSIEVGIFLFLMLAARWYTVHGAMARVGLEKKWRAYRKKNRWSVAALGSVPVVLIATALISNQILLA